MKKFISKTSIFMVVTLILMTFSTVLISASSEKSIKLNSNKITIAISESYDLFLENTDEEVKWSSNDKSIAVVNQSGEVTGKGEGETIVVAKIGKAQYKCKVIVKKYRVSAENSIMSIDDTQKLNLYGKINGKTVTWISNNEKVATVSNNGTVTAKKAGKVKIGVKIDDIIYHTTLTVNPNVRINEVVVDNINSVGGVDVAIYWKNLSNKTIKYITFLVEPYNAVGDKVSSNIDKKTTSYLKITGPVEPYDINNEELIFFKKSTNEWVLVNKYGYYYDVKIGNFVILKSEEIDNIMKGSYWEAVWYNNTIKTIKLTGVEIIYMDESTEKFYGNDLNSIQY